MVLNANSRLLCVDSHACYFVELPTPPGAARGVRIIFDPVFSKRCSPSSFLGPARFSGKALTLDASARSHLSPPHALKMRLAKLKTSLPSMLLCFRYVSSSRWLSVTQIASIISIIITISAYIPSLRSICLQDNLTLCPAPIYRLSVAFLPTRRPLPTYS